MMTATDGSEPTPLPFDHWYAPGLWPAGSTPWAPREAVKGEAYRHLVAPPDLVRLSSVEGRSWNVDAALVAALRGELDLWVPCRGWWRLKSEALEPLDAPFGRLQPSDVLPLLRRGRVRLRWLELDEGFVRLRRGRTVQVDHLFIAGSAIPPAAGAPREPGSHRPSPPAPTPLQPVPAEPNPAPRGPREPAAGASSGRPAPAQLAPGEPAPPEPPDRILRRDEVLALVGLSRSTLWRLERAGEFPARRKLSRQAVGWSEGEVRSWMARRAAAGPRAAQGRDGTR